MDYLQYIQNLITRASQDFGTSSFFSSPSSARQWVENRVILPNPRLSSIEKDVLMQNSENAYLSAMGDCQGNPSPSALNECALVYWRIMQDAVVLNTNDQKLYDIFEVGVDAAESTSNPESVVPSSSLKIPWWVWLFGGLFVLNVARK